MHTLFPIGLSAARRLASTLLSIVWPATGSPRVERTAPTARLQQLNTVSTDDFTAGAHTADQVHTVTFGLDGTSYEITLSAGQAAVLRGDLAIWMSHARRTSGSTATPDTRRPTTRTTTGSSHTSMIRRWARVNGHTVSDRGRLPAAVRRAYDAAH